MPISDRETNIGGALFYCVRFDELPDYMRITVDQDSFGGDRFLFPDQSHTDTFERLRGWKNQAEVAKVFQCIHAANIENIRKQTHGQTLVFEKIIFELTEAAVLPSHAQYRNKTERHEWLEAGKSEIHSIQRRLRSVKINPTFMDLALNSLRDSENHLPSLGVSNLHNVFHEKYRIINLLQGLEAELEKHVNVPALPKYKSKDLDKYRSQTFAHHLIQLFAKYYGPSDKFDESIATLVDILLSTSNTPTSVERVKKMRERKDPGTDSS